MNNHRQIIFIMTDTQRRDMLGCYGNREMHTPSLDRLAREGLRFDQAYTCQPVCGPARSAIFTGTWPHSNGSWSNCQPLGDNVKTIGQRLRDNGLETAYIGKWHLDGGDYFGLGRCPDGWNPDYWYDMRNYLEELSPEDRKRSREFETCLESDFSADFTFAHRCSNRAIDFLQTHQENDFFLVVSYDEPHHPWLCPPPFNTMYQGYQPKERPNWYDDLENKPAHHRVWAGPNIGKGPQQLGPQFWQGYYGSNAFVDAEIGRVVDAIDQTVPESLVIYTSDHGDGLGSHAITNKGPAMYDEITRIPLIVRWPGHTPADQLCQYPVSHIDLAPTIMAAAGLPVPKLLEGRSMLATFQQPEIRPNESVFIEYGRYEVDHDDFGGFQPIRAACDGRYKLVINLLTTDEFYDLET
ncbi:sulfatase-like hydrolase/transferase, partial [bacterium]|nr:sulfatase-like hydrolase/transferase [bacterium]